MNPQHYATYNPQQQQQQQQFYAGAYATQSGMSAPAMGGAPPLHAWTPPSPQEQQYYDMLFAHVDEQRRNAIGGQQAVAFFSRSHLDKAILREVWSIADTQRKSELSRNEFYVAMRLISLAQRGEQVSVQKFVQFAAMQFPLPVLEGVPPPPQGMHPAGGMQQMQHPPQHPAPVQTQAQQQEFGAVHQQPPSSNGAAYAVTADEKSKYDIVFQQYDTDRDGFLMGPEAVALFQMSGLDRNVLRDIWSMADVTQDSKLSLQEFYVAMHLIVCVSKRGLPMPQTLPRELGETAFGAGGASQSMPGQDAFASQNGFGAQQHQETVPPPKPEAASQPATGNLLFSPEPSPAAVTGSSGFDSFGDFGSASTDNAASTPAPEKSSGNSPFSPVAADSSHFNGFGDFSSASTPADSASATEKPAETSGGSPFSPVAADAAASSFEAFGDFNAAPTSTDSAAAASEPSKSASGSGNSPFSPVAADSSGFDDFSSAPATADSTTTPSESKPDNGGFEAFGDFSAAPVSSDSSSTAAGKDASDNNGFGAFGDFNGAPSTTAASDGFGNFGNFN
ncbi:transcription factor [Phytophthora cinnamomi]|uniref:transcription factor n=1 Tax=Phytophthora cinnamomi TaxID=4785 RepID=UPI003559653D|nr:transcription factor [Phytophthora cinnamomi]